MFAFKAWSQEFFSYYSPLLGYLAILFNGLPKLAACWSDRGLLWVADSHSGDLFTYHSNIADSDLQAVIERIDTLMADDTLTGVLDDRGKFIYITQDELESVAKFIKQRGRVSIQELAECSNRLIRLTPDLQAVETSAWTENHPIRRFISLVMWHHHVTQIMWPKSCDTILRPKSCDPWSCDQFMDTWWLSWLMHWDFDTC